MQRSEHGGGDLALVALPLEAQERGVEKGEVLAGVLEVDADELGGDLELHHRGEGASAGLTAP